MENQLSAMEKRIEELLAQAEKNQVDVQGVQDGAGKHDTADKST